MEILVVLGLTTIIFAALFSSWGFIGRSTLAMIHYTELNSIGRTGLEVFARDVRRARKIEEGFTSADMTLLVEDEDGNDSGIEYRFDAEEKTLLRTEAPSTVAEPVFKDVEWLELSYFQTTGDEALNSLETRLIQLELRMSRDVQGRDATKKIVSARYIMRNKQYSE